MKQSGEIHTEFQAYMKKFSDSEKDRVKLVAESGGRYLVLHRDPSWENFRIEVSAGRQLPEGVRWTPEQAQQLYDLGFRQGRASKNFMAIVKDKSEWEGRWANHAEQVITTLLNDEQGEPHWVLREEQEERFQSEGIIEAMNHVAKNRTWQARTGLYRLLLQSRLLVLVNGKGAGHRVEFGQVGSMGTWGVTAAFTSYEALDAYAPKGADVLALPGDILFPELAVAKIGALKLNPGTAPTGELYANEIQMMVEGLKKMTGVH